MANAIANLTRKLRKPATGSTRVRLVEAEDEQDLQRFAVPWWLAAVSAALLTALIGWLFWVALSFLAWTVAPQIDPMITLHIASQGWLLSHGIAVGLPGARLSIVPLGMTALIVLLGTGFCNWVATRIRPPEEPQSALRATLTTSGAFALSYLVILFGVRQWSDGDIGFNPLLSLIVAFAIPLISFGRANGWRPLAAVPEKYRWLRAVPPAAAAGIGFLLAAGALVLSWAFIASWGRVRELHDALQAGIAGGIVLVILQALYLPNMLLWATSWVTGAGIQVGYGSVVSPARTDLGMLPALPVFGALPQNGPQPDAMVWWAATTLIAGALAAWLLLRALRRDAAAWPTYVVPQIGDQRVLDPVRSAILGAMLGISSGLILVVIDWFASGDLGNIRLVDLGARLGPLAVMASTGMGIGGMLTASLIAWQAARSSPTDVPSDANLDGDPSAAPSCGGDDAEPPAQDADSVEIDVDATRQIAKDD